MRNTAPGPGGRRGGFAACEVESVAVRTRLWYQGLSTGSATLGVQLLATYESEVCDFVKSFGDRQWHGAVHMCDIPAFPEDYRYARAVCGKLGLDVDVVLIVAGFPCEDTSKRKADRKNLLGRESGNFKFFVRILVGVRCVCPSVPVEFLLENTLHDGCSGYAGSSAVQVEAGAVLPCTRLRMYSCN